MSDWIKTAGLAGGQKERERMKKNTVNHSKFRKGRKVKQTTAVTLSIVHLTICDEQGV